MYHSAAFQIPPPRLSSMTESRRNQAADIVIIIHFCFSPFLSFPSFSFLPFFFLSFFSSPPTLNSSPLHPDHHPHSHPVAPDHSPSEARSHRPTDSHLRSKPTPSPPPSAHLHQRELEPATPWHRECIAHNPQLIEDALLVHTECHESPLQSPARRRQKDEIQAGTEMFQQLNTQKQPPQRCSRPPQNQHDNL